VREDADTAQVNLLLNRAARLLDIDSYIPYEGKVVITNKAARRISVRIPAWVARKDLRVDVGGAPRRLDWVGNFIVLDGLKPGAITLRFPMPESTARYTVNANTDAEITYTCSFRGSTLIDISPREESPTSYRIYQREHMRGERAPLRTVERFLADASVPAW
jgi:hypothetical protein